VKSVVSRRSLAPAAALVLMLAQLLAGHAGVFAGALAAGFAGHGHELSLLGDAGHVDVVLHHGDRDDSTGTAGPDLGAHDGDHVVHFATSDAVRGGNARVGPPAPTLPIAAPMQPRESGSRAFREAAAVADGSAALLRTVVLRI